MPTNLFWRVSPVVVLALWASTSTSCGTVDQPASEDASEPVPETETRVELLLNGTWDVAEGELGDEAPTSFDHTTPVPGLITSAVPAFENPGNRRSPEEAFWYRRIFEGPAARDVYLLNIHKAKYGIRVWLNDIYVGEHLGSYTLATFDVSNALLPGESNTLLVRLGVGRQSVPAYVPAGQDLEKSSWVPGIWDDVVLVGTNNTRVARAKIEADIDNAQARALLTLENHGRENTSVAVALSVRPWPDGEPVYTAEEVELVLQGYQITSIELTVEMPEFQLWSPESPFLYQADIVVRREDGNTDELSTRFGMRKVEWVAGEDYSGMFHLNNEPYYLRGSNITMHRFFEDPLVGQLPWDEDWVRALLGTYPKDLHWNSMRMSLGRAPNLWYDVADEVGLLIADEFQMWNGADRLSNRWSKEEMILEFTEWVQESWNHPSIAWWDAANETIDPRIGEIIDVLRPLDPTRQWETGGFNAPHTVGDPIEDHPYVFLSAGSGLGDPADMRILEEIDGQPPGGGYPGNTATFDEPTSGYINNEYGHFWLNRDGTPTTLSRRVLEDLIGEGPHSVEVLREASAYFTAGMTEFWRASRGYAGVLHFSYLTYSKTEGQTADYFIDIETPTLEPRFIEYAQYAFAPLGVYIDAWGIEPQASENLEVPVITINDHPFAVEATLELLAVDLEGNIVSRSDAVDASLGAFADDFCTVSIEPPATGPFLLVAELRPEDTSVPTVWSRRKVRFENLGDPAPDPPYGD